MNLIKLGGAFMEKSQRYMELFSQYKNMTDGELLKIVNSGDEYQPIAKEVANDILKSDRSEYYQNIQKSEKQEAERQQKIELTENHPLYNDIHQIAGDIRFLKNLIIVGLILGIFLTLVCAFTIL